MKTILTVVALVLLAGPAAFAAEPIEGINSISMAAQKDLTIDQGGKIKIVADNGDVKIRTWPHQKVLVRSEAVHQAIIVTGTTDNGDVAIHAKGFTTGSTTSSAIHVIYVPVGSNVSIQLSNGELTVEDPQQSLQIEAEPSPSLGSL